MRAFRLLRKVTRWIPIGSVVAIAVVMSLGGLRSFSTLRWSEIGAVAFLLVGVTNAAIRQAMSWQRGKSRPIERFELGAGLLASAFVLVSLGGPPLFPIVYLLMAFLVSFSPRYPGLGLLAVALAFDAITTAGKGLGQWGPLFTHAAFLILFTALYHWVLGARLALARKAEQEAVKHRLKEIEDGAKTFRLVSSGTAESVPGTQAREKWLYASVRQLEEAAAAALEILEIALSAHTSALFLLADDDRSLKLFDGRSRSDRLRSDRLLAGEGLLGGVTKRGLAVRLTSAEPLKALSYYDGQVRVCSVLAVPLIEEGGRVRGVLLADRTEAIAFKDEEERLVQRIAAELLRAIEVERVMNYVQSAREEKERFFKAIEELNRASSPDQVLLAVLDGARQLGGLDFSAVTLVSETDGKRSHRIARLSGVAPAGRALEGRVFDDNHGLVANVVRYGSPLPGRSLKGSDVIFDDESEVRGLAGLKIFPLSAGGRILGTLVAGTRKRSALDHEVVRMLEVLAIQAAQAILRAQLYDQMATMATTDGLTGLLNHRSFQARLEEALAYAKRYQRTCSVILTDIDHFKGVNDTYGHPIGDKVLKQVAKIVKEKARDTDVVARYGGEEFAIVMPETDAKVALGVAERIREAVKACVVPTELGPLKVTLSLGISTFPEAATEKAALVDLADQCLYYAKRNGRDRSVTVEAMRSGKKPERLAAG